MYGFRRSVFCVLGITFSEQREYSTLNVVARDCSFMFIVDEHGYVEPLNVVTIDDPTEMKVPCKHGLCSQLGIPSLPVPTAAVQQWARL